MIATRFVKNKISSFCQKVFRAQFAPDPHVVNVPRNKSARNDSNLDVRFHFLSGWRELNPLSLSPEDSVLPVHYSLILQIIFFHSLLLVFFLGLFNFLQGGLQFFRRFFIELTDSFNQIFLGISCRVIQYFRQQRVQY